MNNKKPKNLTINIHADDQLRSSYRNSNTTTRIELSSAYILYPQLFDVNAMPSVPVCHKQESTNKNLDRKIEANFE